MSAPVIIMALYRARKLVKEDLRAKGIKVSEVPKRDIDVLAQLYLELHPELIPAARETIDKLTLDGAFGKRAQRALVEAKSVQKATGLRTLAQPQATQREENRL